MSYEDTPLEDWTLEELEREKEFLVKDRQDGLLDWHTYKEAKDMVLEEINRRTGGVAPSEAYDRAMKGL